MNRRRTILITLLSLAAALSAASCSTSSTRPLSERVGQALAEGWVVEQSREHFEGWTVHSADSCIVVMSRTTSEHAEETRPRRAFTCVDPLSGEERWRYEHPVSKGFSRERLLFTKERMIYLRPDLAIGISLSDGALVWELDDQIGRMFQNAALEEGLLVLDLDHDVLVVLDADQGTWVRGVSLSGGKLHAVLPGPGGPMAIVTRTSEEMFEDKEVHLLEGFDVLGPGGEQPAPPRAEPNARWSVEIDEGDHKLTRVGDTLVGYIKPGHLSILDPTNGETLHEVEHDQNVAMRFSLASTTIASSPTSAPSATNRPKLTATQLLERARLEEPPPLGDLSNRRIELEQDQPWLLLQGPRQGVAMTLVELEAYNPRTLEKRWKTTLPWAAKFRVFSRHPELNAFFIANPRQAALLDTTTGEVLWSDDLDPENGAWLGGFVRGAALYLLYQEDTEVRLMAKPLLHHPGVRP